MEENKIKSRRDGSENEKERASRERREIGEGDLERDSKEREKLHDKERSDEKEHERKKRKRREDEAGPWATQVIPNGPVVGGTSDGAAWAAPIAVALSPKHKLEHIEAVARPELWESELDIIDFPWKARWKVTLKKTQRQISEFTGAAITTRWQLLPGEKRLYLLIEGPSASCVIDAKSELLRVLEDSLPASAQLGRYLSTRNVLVNN